jgi:hypothetical protein
MANENEERDIVYNLENKPTSININEINGQFQSNDTYEVNESNDHSMISTIISSRSMIGRPNFIKQ